MIVSIHTSWEKTHLILERQTFENKKWPSGQTYWPLQILSLFVQQLNVGAYAPKDKKGKFRRRASEGLVFKPLLV